MAYIHCVDLQETSEAIIAYYSKLEGEYAQAVSAINQLVALDSFTGKTATSVKTYFQEVHPGLLAGFVSLFDHLQTAFHDYVNGYTSDPVNEDGAKDGKGKLPTEGISDVKRKVKNANESGVAGVETLLARAARKVEEASCYADKPSTSDLSGYLDDLVGILKKLNNDIEDNESKGLSLFSDDSTFAQIQSGLRLAVATCLQPNYATGYMPGDIKSESWYGDLSKALGESQTYRTEKYDMVMETQTALADQKQTRIEYEKEQALKEKTFWSAIGTAASMVTLLCGVVAVAAATGPVGILLGGVVVASGMMDTFSRANNLGKLIDGDAESDREKYGMSGVGKDVYDSVSGYAKNIEKYGVERGSIQQLDDIGDGFTSDVVGSMTEEAVYGLTGDRDGAEALGSLTKKTLSVPDTAQKIVEGGIGGVSAGIGFASECVTVLADYKSAKADEAIDACNDELGEVAKTRERIANSNGPFTCSWAA